jgi:hypothetical protein
MLRFESEPACPSKLLIARCYSTIRARIRPNGFERILAHRIGCQRATASLSSRVASKQLCNYSEDGAECQHLGTKKFGISTRLLRAPLSFLEGERYSKAALWSERFDAARPARARSKNPIATSEILEPVGSRHTLAVRDSSFLLSLSPNRQSLTRCELTTLASEILRGKIYRGQRRNQIPNRSVILAGNETPKPPSSSAAWTAYLSVPLSV